MNRIKIFYAQFNDENMAAICDKWLSFFPFELQQINLAYRKQIDRTRNLLGKLLLVEALKDAGLAHYKLSDMQYTTLKKPYLSEDFDFSIAHAGYYVCCAFVEAEKIGIDIEETLPLDFEDYTYAMSASEWDIIKNSPDPLHTFYIYWTKKEALIKACGLGFFAPLEKIYVQENAIFLDKDKWYTTPIILDEQHLAHLASKIEQPTIEMIKIDFI